MDNIGVIRLKLTGCGQSLELEVENGETVGRLLDKCAEEMGGGVSRRHVKLVARGKNLGRVLGAVIARGCRHPGPDEDDDHAHGALSRGEGGPAKLGELAARADAVADPASAAGQEMRDAPLLCESTGRRRQEHRGDRAQPHLPSNEQQARARHELAAVVARLRRGSGAPPAAPRARRRAP